MHNCTRNHSYILMDPIDLLPSSMLARGRAGEMPDISSSFEQIPRDDKVYALACVRGCQWHLKDAFSKFVVSADNKGEFWRTLDAMLKEVDVAKFQM